MTNQEMFDKVATHLLTQNARSGGVGNCKYRTPEGLKCAAGCLIPDEFYSPGLEGLNATAERMMGMWKSAGTLFGPRGEVLLNRLQRIHDTSEISDWRESLECVASDYQLNADVLKKFGSA